MAVKEAEAAERQAKEAERQAMKAPDQQQVRRSWLQINNTLYMNVGDLTEEE